MALPTHETSSTSGTSTPKSEHDSEHDPPQLRLLTAMVGYTASNERNVAGTLVLQGIEVKVRLSPWSDVQSRPQAPHSYLSIKCGDGRWLKAKHLRAHQRSQFCVDLTDFTKLAGHGGRMEFSSNAPSAQSEVKEECWAALIERFEFLIAQLVLFRREAAMCFWCKGGRHRSYALLIFF